MVQVRNDIHWVGVNDRTTDLFEAVWPLPHGVSYNCYLIDGDQTALIDTVHTKFSDKLVDQVSELIKVKELDYVVINHMEPDHSGSIPTIRQLAPEVELVGTKRTKSMLQDFYGIENGVKVVEEGDQLELGNYTLEFYETPFVHWPETMMTYEPEEQVLFSGDAFGGFGALNGGIFDDQTDLSFYRSEIRRYFSNIVGSYTSTVMAALNKLKDTPLEVVAPAHGSVWRSTPTEVVDLYRQWSHMTGETGVTVIYGSMYGNTESCLEAVLAGLESGDCPEFKVLDASRVDVSYLISEAWAREGLIIGSPTYNGKLFPPVDNFARHIQNKRLKNRRLGIFGSYGWAGGAVRELKELAEELSWDLISPAVEFSGSATSEEKNRAHQLGITMAEQIRSEQDDG